MSIPVEVHVSVVQDHPLLVEASFQNGRQGHIYYLSEQSGTEIVEEGGRIVSAKHERPLGSFGASLRDALVSAFFEQQGLKEKTICDSTTLETRKDSKRGGNSSS